MLISSHPNLGININKCKQNMNIINLPTFGLSARLDKLRDETRRFGNRKVLMSAGRSLSAKVVLSSLARSQQEALWRSRPPSSLSPSLHLSLPPCVGRRTLAEGALRKVKKMWRHVHLKWKLVLWVLRLPFFPLRAFKGNTLPDGSLVGAEAEVPLVQFVVPTSVPARTLQQNSTLCFPEGINSW